LQVTPQEQALVPGKETTCEIRVLNAGSKAVTNLRILAVLPAGITPRRGDGPTRAQMAGQQVFFEPQPALAPLTQTVYRLYVKGERPTGSTARMRVLVSCDQLTVPQVRDESLWVYRN